MGKVARARMIEAISKNLLNVYRNHKPEDPELAKNQNEVLSAFKAELQAQGKSRTTINDYLSCGMVRALETYKKELKGN